jgi:SAM-dependent methyltransferase
MSRLDSYIRRMQAQKLCLDHAAQLIGTRPGLILELGFGNGRTYDHLRELFPDRKIYVFDRQINPHPDCIPPADMVRLGDARETLARFLEGAPEPAILIHADIGTGDKIASLRLAQDLASTLSRLLAPGGLVAADQPLPDDGIEPLPLPKGVKVGRYHLYRRKG